MQTFDVVSLYIWVSIVQHVEDDVDVMMRSVESEIGKNFPSQVELILLQVRIKTAS